MFCVSCGTKIKDGIKFCPGCGTQVGATGVSINQDKAVNFIQPQPAVLPAASLDQSAIMADEMYCFSCGSIIKKAAVICPRCGVNQSMRSGTTAIDVYCASCGKTIKKEATTCQFCGVMQEGNSGKNKTTALLLIIFTAVGHRFYTGKIGTGILMALVFIFCSIFQAVFMDTEDLVIGVLFFVFLVGYLVWWISDLVGICTGKFRDSKGNPLKKSG